MAKILIVDDASLIRNIAKKAVLEAGHEVVLANDGKEGFEAVLKGGIDFVFSDINMPIMTGMEMIAKIRQEDKYRYLPIVMLTTENKSELQKQAQGMGVKAWLVKPFNKDKFLLVLNKLLG
ncbi:MAG: response regulator [Arcobacter sp.]|nr:MAG: response regulator [Arcobacter sp.]